MNSNKQYISDMERGWCRVTLKTIRAPSKLLVAGDEIAPHIAAALLNDFPERELYIGD